MWAASCVASRSSWRGGSVPFDSRPLTAAIAAVAAASVGVHLIGDRLQAEGDEGCVDSLHRLKPGLQPLEYRLQAEGSVRVRRLAVPAKAGTPAGAGTPAAEAIGLGRFSRFR